nr:MAG TPA: hypothetical protein [Microviridae sp.]
MEWYAVQLRALLFSNANGLEEYPPVFRNLTILE